MKRLLRDSLLVRNTFWMMGGNGVRLFLQAIYFLIIARALGAREYGAFIGTVSLVALVVPFSSWGTGFLLVKETTRDRGQFARYWGTALSMTAFSGCVLLGGILLVARAVWGISVPLGIVLLVGISDAIMVRIVDLANQAFMAVEVLRKSAQLYVVLSAARTLAAVYLSFAVHNTTAESWALLYLLSAVAAATYGVVEVTRALGLPTLGVHISRPELKEGFYFSVCQSSQTIYNDIDKTMLVRFGGLEATGIYGAAYRIVDVCIAPLGSLVAAAYPRFFRHGENGIAGSIGFAKKLLPYSAAYGLLAAILLAVASPLLPLLLGKGFATAMIALQWLSPLIFIKSIYYFLADSLSGAGHQGPRTAVQLGVVGINVLLNLWLIPTYSWRGAAWASIASDGALAVGLFATIAVLKRKSMPETILGADSSAML